MRIGSVRYLADIDPETGKIEFTELVLRSIQNRKKYEGHEWFGGPRKVCYWIVKHKGVTWVKRSKSHGDWGWADSIPKWLRYSALADSKQPGSPTKKGALRKILADCRRFRKDWGDTDPEYPDELPYSEQIKRIQRALARTQ